MTKEAFMKMFKTLPSGQCLAWRRREGYPDERGEFLIQVANRLDLLNPARKSGAAFTQKQLDEAMKGGFE